MTSKIFKLAVACAVAGVSCLAQASPVTLDFSGLVANVDHQTVPSNYINGFVFTPVTAYANGYLGLSTFSGAGAALFSASTFTISVVGQQFDTITFHGGSSNASIEATAYSAGGSVLGTGGPGGFGGSFGWDTVPTTLGGGLIDHVSFTTLTGNQVFAIDNITFDLSTQPGGNVPEPAGLGLVALALAAGGLASKRRKSA